MNSGRTVFAQVMEHIPHPAFQAAVARYDGDRKVRRFTCWDQWLVLAFAQLTWRESLRDIEVCLRAMQPRLYHMGIRARISRNTLAVANERRNWRIHAEFALALIGEARALYAGDALDTELRETVQATFVTRAKTDMASRRRYSRKVDRSTGLVYDQTIVLIGPRTRKDYPTALRCVRYIDPETNKKMSFLTNNFELPALTIALLYKGRWRIELFFKWIKQHLRALRYVGWVAPAGAAAAGAVTHRGPAQRLQHEHIECALHDRQHLRVRSASRGQHRDTEASEGSEGSEDILFFTPS